MCTSPCKRSLKSAVWAGTRHEWGRWKNTRGQETPAMGLPSGRASICWAWREDRWAEQMVNRQWGGSVPPGGRRDSEWPFHAASQIGIMSSTHTLTSATKKLSWHLVLQWVSKPAREKRRKKKNSLEGLPAPRGPPPAASQMEIKRPTPWIALSKDGVAGGAADGRTANQQEVPGVVNRKFSKELQFLKSPNFVLSLTLSACSPMRNMFVIYPKPAQHFPLVATLGTAIKHPKSVCFRLGCNTTTTNTYNLKCTKSFYYRFLNQCLILSFF